MCNVCRSLGSNRETRRSFLTKLTAGLAISAGMFCAHRAFGQTSAAAVPRGSRVSWARLITPHPFWELHGEQDALVANFIRREVHLNLEAASYSADPAQLEILSSFPFILTNDLTPVVDATQLANLKEYLQRGGFFFVEACLDHRVTRGFGDYLARHSELFARLVPGSEVRRLPASHAIFQSYFPVEESRLGLLDPGVDAERWKDAPQALYGVFARNRMVSLISLFHLQCQWIIKPEKTPACLQQIANIYVYALTR